MANPKNLKSWQRASMKMPQQCTADRRVGVPGDYVHFCGTEADAAYVEWLANARGISHKQALAYCDQMDRRTLISAIHENDGMPAANGERWRLKSKWWKPQSLRTPAFTRGQLSHQAAAYRKWMKERDGQRAIDVPLAA